MQQTETRGIALTVVVPAFNEAARLPHSLPTLMSAIDELDMHAEIVLVDDGSTDGTSEIAEQCFDARDHARIVRLPWNCGKGAAVRAGVSVAKGESIVFLDADLAADMAHLPRLIAMLETSDIALGSRSRAGAQVEGRTTARRLSGNTYQMLVRYFTTVPIVDTQCGFKAFRAPAAKLLFSMTTATGFGFDVEILTLASTLGLRVEECPIRWTAIDGGHVSALQHGIGMLRDLMRARRHQRRTLAWNWTVAQAGHWRPHLPGSGEPHVAPAIIRLDPPGSETLPAEPWVSAS